jgi:hypothetical protein
MKAGQKQNDWDIDISWLYHWQIYPDFMGGKTLRFTDIA